MTITSKLRILSIIASLFLVGRGVTGWAADTGRHVFETNHQACLELQGYSAYLPCKKAAELGDAGAQFKLGVMYEAGQGVKKDYTEAIKWYRRAAAQGDADAQFNLGLMYDLGRGLKRNHSEAVKLYRKAEEQGHAYAKVLLNLGVMSAMELQCLSQYKAHKYQQALITCKKAAPHGKGLAQYILGTMYTRGEGVKKDDAVSFRWYRMAADYGIPDAEYEIFIRLSDGTGVKMNAAEASRWEQKAAEHGNFPAQALLSAKYNLEQDYSKAGKWYYELAERGDIDKQVNLGRAYLYGYGLNQDYFKAIKWFKKAAKQGDASAEFYLGTMYRKGQGVKQDYSETVKWYRKAAEQGDAAAQFNLGAMYSGGRGVMQSGAAAADWYYKAGLTYFRQGNRDDALSSVERIKSLSDVLHLTVPNAFLADRLLTQIYGGGKGGSSSSGDKAKKPASRDKSVMGTGWPVASGYIVTNWHVVSGHSRLTLILTDGTQLMAKVAINDKANDLALLKVHHPAALPPALPLAQAPAQLGEQVFTIGYPHPDVMGSDPKLTDGVISSIAGMGDDPRFYQISVPLQGGNSGGPLINMKGEAVGIVESKLSAVRVFKLTGDLTQNVNYAVKIPYLTALISMQVKGKAIPVLPHHPASLSKLASQIKDSIIMILAQ